MPTFHFNSMRSEIARAEHAKSIHIVLGAETRPESPDAKALAFTAELKKQFGSETFDTAGAAQHLQISERSASRYLKVACSDGTVKKIGKASSTRYRMA